jgi:hypothetical protein
MPEDGHGDWVTPVRARLRSLDAQLTAAREKQRRELSELLDATSTSFAQHSLIEQFNSSLNLDDGEHQEALEDSAHRARVEDAQHKSRVQQFFANRRELHKMELLAHAQKAAMVTAAVKDSSLLLSVSSSSPSPLGASAPSVDMGAVEELAFELAAMHPDYADPMEPWAVAASLDAQERGSVAAQTAERYALAHPELERMRQALVEQEASTAKAVVGLESATDATLIELDLWRRAIEEERLATLAAQADEREAEEAAFISQVKARFGAQKIEAILRQIRTPPGAAPPPPASSILARPPRHSFAPTTPAAASSRSRSAPPPVSRMPTSAAPPGDAAPSSAQTAGEQTRAHSVVIFTSLPVPRESALLQAHADCCTPSCVHRSSVELGYDKEQAPRKHEAD